MKFELACTFFIPLIIMGLLLAVPNYTNEVVKEYQDIITLNPCIRNISDSYDLSLEEQLNSDYIESDIKSKCSDNVYNIFITIKYKWINYKFTNILGIGFCIFSVIMFLILLIVENKDCIGNTHTKNTNDTNTINNTSNNIV